MHPSTLKSGPLQTERLANGDRKLLRDLVVEVESRVITVNEGFASNFSSIPWFARFVVRWSRVDVAGVVHDKLYASTGYTRAEADRVWRRIAMSGEHRANAVQAWTCWVGLRIAGWLYWKGKPDSDE